jgi:mannitol/fructose-specific phosphotransferase system IIA component (Ntr-type)/CBS domain-containing protein
MRLANLLKESLVLHNLKAETKEAAIDELLDILKKEHPAVNLKVIKDLIIEREDIENTSYGHGFAFPHARTDEIDEMHILVGVSKNGLKDRTRDNIPLAAVILLLTPSNIPKLYLQALSAFATFARTEGNLQKLAAASSADDVVDIIWQSRVKVEKELTAKDLMHRDVVSVTPDDTLKTAANLMFKNRMSCLAVVDGDGNLLGQITDKDLITAALSDYEAIISTPNSKIEGEPFEELIKKENQIKVSQLYKTDYATAKAETSLVDVAALMIQKDLRRVFVTKENKLVGILARKDIVNMIIRG